MQEMSFWELVRNSPEWVAVLANALFALVATLLVIWQIVVSKGLLTAQNRLIRLQHEHDWLLRSNGEREQILKITGKFHLASSLLRPDARTGDRENWLELQDTYYELSLRLRILDLGAYTSAYDSWLAKLKSYVAEMGEAITDDFKFNGTYSVANDTPNLSTRERFFSINSRHNPISTMMELEIAIRMEYSEFRSKWNAE